MKNLIALILLCAACYGTNAQTCTSLTVNNNTACSVTFVIRGGDATCGPIPNDVTYTILPFGNAFFSTTLTGAGVISLTGFGFPFGSWISQVDVLPGAGCSGISLPNYACSLGSTPPASFSLLTPPFCAVCSTATVNWNVTNAGTNWNSFLTFN